MAEEPQWITLEEDDGSDAECVLLNNSSKRKASECDLSVVSDHSSKKKRFRSGTPTRHDVPLITVNFSTEDVARRFSDEIARYISNLTKADFSTSTAKDGVECVQFFGGSVPGSDSPAVEDNSISSVDVLPKYDQTFDGVVGVAAENGNDESSTKPKSTCFNCGGDHMIYECPEPRDSARIAKSRREHQSNNVSSSRYHEDADTRYAHLRPGALSERLRDALGVGSDELPAHIYRMRQLGYPPGWLRAARHQRSIAVLHNPKPDKEGAVQKKEGVYYDHSKFISYGGFNVRCSDMRDDHKRLGFPPMQFFQSLIRMKQELPTRNHGQGEPAPPPPQPRQSGTSEADMEVVDIDEEEPDKPTNGAGSSAEEAGGAAHDTKEDGECGDSDEAEDEPAAKSAAAAAAAKSAAAAAAESAAAGAAAADGEDADDGEKAGDGEDADDGGKADDGDDADDDEDAPLVRAPAPAAHSTPLTLTPGASRRRELGTPVSVPASSRIMPDAEKWASGITEHIPFENLPGATGAWSRMSGLIKRVRSHVTGK